MNCLDCGACCRYVVIPIEGVGEDEIKWLEMHEGLKVRNGKLFIFKACKHLGQDNSCGIYAERPKVCRDFKKEGIDCIKSRMLMQISMVKSQSENPTKESNLNP